MRCPECKKRISARNAYKGVCKKCGYKYTMKDYFRPNWQCPMFDLCNFADKCYDEDWEHCGTYSCFMGFIRKINSNIKMEPIVEDYSALKPFRLKCGINCKMEMVE